MRYLVGDIGRTKTRLAISQDGETLSEPVVRPTPESFAAGRSLFEQMINSLKGEAGSPLITCVGISRQVWPGSPLKIELEKLTGGAVYLENDSALAGLAEATVGAGRGHRLVVYVTVSTGVGGAKIVDGRINDNAFGFEPGQQIVVVDGQPRTLESLVSGRAVSARFGRPAYEIKDEQIWADLSHYLAIGLANSLLHWSPEVLVLGGSMFRSPGFEVAVVAQLMADHLKIFSGRPLVRRTRLSDLNGLHGALVYLRRLSKRF